jgi:hypothetical protein
MTAIAALYAFVVAHSAEILGIWLLIEQLLAANPNIKANSTFQLVSNLIKAAIGNNKG